MDKNNESVFHYNTDILATEYLISKCLQLGTISKISSRNLNNTRSPNYFYNLSYSEIIKKADR
jgi:hypothetical protein